MERRAIASKAHILNLKRKQASDRNVPIEQKALQLVPNLTVGSKYVDQVDRQYRCEGLFAAAIRNIPIKSLCNVENFWVN